MGGSVWAFALAAMAGAGASPAALDQPRYEPAPAWIAPVAIPADVKPGGAAAEVLLWDAQDRVAPDHTESFIELATRVNAAEGLSSVGSLQLTWNPATDSLAIHRARILRGGHAIDLLADGRRFAVLRREPNLEAAMIDGQLTATLQPEDVRVGDVVDVAYTLTHREPALAGHAEDGVSVGHEGAVGRLVLRVSWPAGKPFGVWKTDDLPAMSPETRDGWTTIGLDQRNAVSPEPPQGASTYDRLFGMVNVSDFRDWSEVSATSYPLYARAAGLAPASPLRAQIDAIRAAHADEKGRALAALQLAENQVRYLYVGLDAGGYTPAAADLTWSRRFGDCKGKTALLLALLQGLGIAAEPALVNTATGDGLDRARPQMGAFDHVLVRAVIAGRVYWLDATRVGDENLELLDAPDDHWALPVRPGGAPLEALKPREPDLPLAETILKVDARAGIAQPAKVREELVFRRDLGWAMGVGLRNASPTDRDRLLRRALSRQYDWVTPQTLDFAYDPQRMEARITVVGSGRPPFTSQGGAGAPRDWLIDASQLVAERDLTRTSPYHRDAAFQVGPPSYARSVVQVELPDHGAGFEVLNSGVLSETVAGLAVSRSAAVNEGRFIMLASSRTVASSFPAAEAEATQAKLRQIAEYPFSLRYTPPAAAAAKVDTPAVTPPAAPPDSAAAAAEDAFARRDYRAAVAGFTAALAASPSARLYYDRAAARAALGDSAGASADLDAALKLQPRYPLGLLALGRLDLARGASAEAASHFAAAVTASDGSGRILAAVGGAYAEAGRFAEAAVAYDAALAAVPAVYPRAPLLNTVCWMRARWGRELVAAKRECDEALSLSPGNASYLDSRGLVQLRAGAPDEALRDYSDALSRRPGVATSLYGRGLAEARLHRTAEAKADMDAARAASPGIDAQFAGWGVSR